MAIQRHRRPPHPVTFTEGALTLYEIELSAADVLGAGGAPGSIRGFAGKRLRSLQSVVLR